MTPFYLGNSTSHNSLNCSCKNFCFNLVILGMVFVSIVLYLVEITALVTFTFKTDSLKQRITELQGDNQSIETRFNQSNSLNQLDDWAQKAGLVAIKQFDYLKAAGEVVAVK